MKLLVFLFFILGSLEFSTATSYSQPIRRAGSLREKLLKNGKYQEFLIYQNRLNSGSQPLLDYSDDYYLLDVSFGSPPQTFKLSLDTASSFLWVLDVNCNSKDCIGKQDRYNNSDSTTFRNGSGTFVAQFDGQPVTGYLAKEKVDFGAGLILQNQDFGSAKVVPQLFLEQPIEGVIGFGFPAMAVNKTKTPLQALMPKLDRQLFTIWMDKRIGNVNGESHGLITYGALDTVHCDANVHYVPLATKSYWGIYLDKFSVKTFTRQQKEMAISDTGSGWIGAPNVVVSAIVQATGAKFDWNLELYTVPCSQIKTQPVLHFTINGIDYAVNSVEYVLNLNLDNGQCALTFFGMVGSGFGPSWVLGDTFIRSFCHIYDYGNQRIGLANAHHTF